MKEVFLSVDIGTTSLKAGFITTDSEVVSVLKIPFKKIKDLRMEIISKNCPYAELLSDAKIGWGKI